MLNIVQRKNTSKKRTGIRSPSISSSSLLSSPFKWNCKSLLFALLIIWIGFFLMFFLYFHSGGNQQTERRSSPKLIDNKLRPKLSEIDHMRHDIFDNPLLNIGIDSEETKIIKLLAKQMDKPAQERKIWEPIELMDLSKYKQPSEIHEIVKSEFLKAEWQP